MRYSLSPTPQSRVSPASFWLWRSTCGISPKYQNSMGGDGRPGDMLFANLIGLTHKIFVGTLVNTFACLHHQEPAWLLPAEFFSADRPGTTNLYAFFFPPETHQTYCSKGNLLQCGQTYDKVTPPIPSIGARIRRKKSVLLLRSFPAQCPNVQFHPLPPSRMLREFFRDCPFLPALHCRVLFLVSMESWIRLFQTTVSSIAVVSHTFVTHTSFHCATSTSRDTGTNDVCLCLSHDTVNTHHWLPCHIHVSSLVLVFHKRPMTCL